MLEIVLMACTGFFFVTTVTLGVLLYGQRNAKHAAPSPASAPAESAIQAAPSDPALPLLPRPHTPYSPPITPPAPSSDPVENLLQATRNGLWDWDRSSDQLYFNSTFLTMLGYQENDFPHHQDTWRALLHPDDRLKAEEGQREALESADSPDTFEHMFRLRAADGSYRWFLGRILSVRRDADGHPQRIVGANVDITDLKALRDKMEESDSRMATALRANSDGMWEWTSDTAPHPGQSCIFTMLGHADDGISTGFMNWRDHIHPEDRDLAVSLHVRIMDSPKHGDSAECTYRYCVAGNEFRWMLARSTVVQRNAEGMAIRVVGVHTDVTELKALHSELETRNERLNYAFAAARDGLWDLDVETDEAYFSPRYVTMMGYTPEEFNAQCAWKNAVHPDDRETVLARQTQYIMSPAFGDSFENTFRMRAADDTYRWVLSRAMVVRRNAEGKGLRVVGMHTDITELRRTQDSLRALLQHDTLTGLHSRDYFESRLELLRDGGQNPVSLIICDVDGLKLVNDSLGHTEGDRLLIHAADILSSAARRGDVVARIGGDEIVLLLPACAEEAASMVMERIRRNLDNHNNTSGRMPVYISIGAATGNIGEVTAESLFRKADQAMLAVKRESRPHVRRNLCDWLQSMNASIADEERLATKE